MGVEVVVEVEAALTCPASMLSQWSALDRSEWSLGGASPWRWQWESVSCTLEGSCAIVAASVKSTAPSNLSIGGLVDGVGVGEEEKE